MIKTFFMLNSTEHETSIVHKTYLLKSIFLVLKLSNVVFILLINERGSDKRVLRAF